MAAIKYYRNSVTFQWNFHFSELISRSIHRFTLFGVLLIAVKQEEKGKIVTSIGQFFFTVAPLSVTASRSSYYNANYPWKRNITSEKKKKGRERERKKETYETGKWGMLTEHFERRYNHWEKKNTYINWIASCCSATKNGHRQAPNDNISIWMIIYLGCCRLVIQYCSVALAHKFRGRNPIKPTIPHNTASPKRIKHLWLCPVAEDAIKLRSYDGGSTVPILIQIAFNLTLIHILINCFSSFVLAGFQYQTTGERILKNWKNQNGSSAAVWRSHQCLLHTPTADNQTRRVFTQRSTD